MDPETGQFMALAYATSRPVEGGGTELLGVSLSREGTHVVVWDRQEFRFGPVDAALSGPFPIPALAPSLEDAKDSDGPRQAQLLFWNARDQLLLSQQLLAADAAPACGVFDSRTHSWQPSRECPEGDYLELTQVDPGPEGGWAITSYAEGAQSLRLSGPSPGGTPPAPESVSFDLYPVNLARAGFSRDGTRLELATPCPLEREHPCRDVEENAPWRLYSWLPRERRLVLTREGLPPWSTPSPSGESTAWPLPGRVCLDKPSVPGSARCHALPGSSCAAHGALP